MFHPFHRILPVLLMALSLAGCWRQYVYDMDNQGHRGCRGLMPENSVPAFLRALELGATSLELDVVITGDRQVLVSHEAWLNHEMCLDTAGAEIAPENEQQFNLFRMSYDEIRRFDCGSKSHPRFPDQQKMKVHKPLLAEVIEASEAYAREHERELPFYNIEVKWEPDGEGIFQPPAAEFVRLVLGTLDRYELGDRVNLQSFDIPTLLEVKKQSPEMRLALLVDENEDYKTRLSQLGFYPEILSPWYKLVDEEMMAFATGRRMKVIPWTVNEVEEMEELMELRVDGIITDYPDRLARLVEGD